MSNSIVAYTYQSDYHCPRCTTRKYDGQQDNADHIAEIGAIFTWDDLRGNWEDGLYCADCGTCMYLPADLETVDDISLIEFTPEECHLMADWHGGQSSYMYAAQSTGALMMANCPHTYRQAALMLALLAGELDDCANGCAVSPDGTAEDYANLTALTTKVADMIGSYTR